MKLLKVFFIKNLSNFEILAIIGLLIFIPCFCRKRHTQAHHRFKTSTDRNIRKVCIQYNQTLKARHKTCFLRPDTGPCRADIIQWYYDVRQSKCYRFFWGGCQGNGNRFETQEQCYEYCFLNVYSQAQIPHFCSLTFNYGDCFGYFNRWAWDTLGKTCKRHLYSGCGGNQNNFQTYQECMDTCLKPPNNTLSRSHSFTTCIPAINIPEVH